MLIILMSGEKMMGLRRELNLVDAVMLVVGNIVGVGIFTTSGIVAQYISHPGWMLFAWFVGGGVALCGALTLGELGAALPRAGGDYAYLREAYPRQVGFLYGWACFWATFSGTIAILSIALADYLSHIFPVFSLEDYLITVPVNISGGHLLAISVILGLTLFNYLGVKLGSRLQNTLTGLKIGLVGAIIWFGLNSGAGDWSNFSGNASSSGVGILVFCQGLIPVWFTYSGWNAITYPGEELKSPERNIPITCAAGVVITLILYLLMNIVYTYALPIDSMSGVIRVAQLAMSRLLGERSSVFISAIVAVSILGCLNATIIVSARIYYAMAHDGLFFANCGKLHPRYGTPGVAMLGQGLWACVLLLSGTFAQLLNFVVFIMLIFSGLTGAAVFRLRYSQPELPRPYRVWGYPLTPALFVGLCLVVALSNLIQQPVQAGLGIAIILTGLPAYYLWRR
jgi:APA family basic amino acid/polyamine antiporter